MPKEACTQQTPGSLYFCKNAGTDLRAEYIQTKCIYSSSRFLLPIHPDKNLSCAWHYKFKTLDAIISISF